MDDFEPNTWELICEGEELVKASKKLDKAFAVAEAKLIAVIKTKNVNDDEVIGAVHSVAEIVDEVQSKLPARYGAVDSEGQIALWDKLQEVLQGNGYPNALADRFDGVKLR